MFSLLRDAFVNDLTVIADYLIDPGKERPPSQSAQLARFAEPPVS